MPRLKYCQGNALAASALRKSNSHGLTFQQNTRVQYRYGDMGVSEKRRVLCIRVDNDLHSPTHTVQTLEKQATRAVSRLPEAVQSTVPQNVRVGFYCDTVKTAIEEKIEDNSNYSNVHHLPHRTAFPHSEEFFELLRETSRGRQHRRSSDQL